LSNGRLPSTVQRGYRRGVFMPVEETSLTTLSDRADWFARMSVSPATRKAYESDWRIFSDFCRIHDLPDYPADPQTVILFISASAEEGLSTGTICRRLTAISAIHEAGECLSPTRDSRVSRVLKGIKRACGSPPNARRAISWDNLISMLRHCDQNIIGRRDAAVLALGWASAMRRSELVALNLGDLEFSEAGLQITIRRSKTDQEGQGSVIGIPRSSGFICPATIVEYWLSRQCKEDLSPDMPLFRRIGASGRGKWWWKMGGRLKPRTIAEIVKQYARYAGLPWEKMSAHSLRRGLATEAAARNVPERIIARHTRHQSMTVLRGYIESGNIWSENPLASIFSQSVPSSDQ
jgi:integrase